MMDEIARIAIKKLLDTNLELKKERRRILDQTQRNMEEIRTLLATSLKIPTKRLELGSWYCPPRPSMKGDNTWFDAHFPTDRLVAIREANPSGRCAYKPVEDPCRDECVFCGMPEERQ